MLSRAETAASRHRSRWRSHFHTAAVFSQSISATPGTAAIAIAVIARNGCGCLSTSGSSGKDQRERREIRPHQDREPNQESSSDQLGLPSVWGNLIEQQRQCRQPQRRGQHVVHRLHDLEQHDRARRREDRRRGARHAAGQPRAIRNAENTSTAPEIGISKKIASRPKTAASGAISTENPGAQIGDAASGRTGDGMKPPGASVRAASGHGASTASGLAGCNRPLAMASAIKA